MAYDKGHGNGRTDGNGTHGGTPGAGDDGRLQGMPGRADGRIAGAGVGGARERGSAVRGAKLAWFDDPRFIPAPYTPGRMVTSMNVLPRRMDDPGSLTRGARHSLRRITELTEGTPLRFSISFFRHPHPVRDGGEEDAGNGWNCRWIEWAAATNSVGERGRYTWCSKRLQFNLTYLHDRLLRGGLLPMLSVSFRPAFPGMDDSPMVTHLDRMFDLLDLADAKRDRILTDDPEKAEPGVLAMIEHTTDAIIPLAAGSRVELTAERDHPDGVVIRVCTPWAMTEPPKKGGEGAARYSWPNEIDDDAAARADISRWSEQLKWLIAMRDRPEYDALRDDIRKLKERMTRDDRLNA